ncbi:MAG: 5-(carboxyamino)imidazole ribonucleotide synthase, partial [Bacteroidales bacterium]|nr:5-(carboxyamino)imidazole ribonucleotide synthase [Bacteroidales bacterium]
MKTIGIIGGGQLGLMIAEQARILGAKTICLDPASDAPAFKICDEHIVAAFDDVQALEELCCRSDVVTYEFENVPGKILMSLEKHIKQGVQPLLDSQDRVR